VLTVILLSIATIALYAGETVIDYLHAKSNGSVITVEWKSVDETDIVYYSVERAGSDQVFEEIATEQAKGYATTYVYTDESAFKTGEDDNKTLSKNIYYYRITIHKKDNSKISSAVTNVTHDPSSIRRTWGMLKEMFR
ncbi:hypothetical protein ACFLSQ_10590, partial [Bacteroidota bacterium]